MIDALYCRSTAVLLAMHVFRAFFFFIAAPLLAVGYLAGCWFIVIIFYYGSFRFLFKRIGISKSMVD